MARGTDIESFDRANSAGYAMSSCTECHRRMTADQLTYFTIEVQSGRRSGTSSSTYFGKRPSTRSGRSSSTYYKNVAKRMCDPCYEAYQLQKAREAKVKLVIGGAIAAVILYCWLVPTKQQPAQNLSQGGRAVSASINSADTTAAAPNAPPPVIEMPASAQSFQAIAPEVQPQAAPAPPIPPPEDLYIVNYLANIRSAPSGPIVGQAAPGEELSVIETKGSWARVRRGNDAIGWVHRNLLTASQR